MGQRGRWPTLTTAAHPIRRILSVCVGARWGGGSFHAVVPTPPGQSILTVSVTAADFA